MTVTSGTFGPSALATPANVVTVVRLLLVPVLVAVILGGGASWPALAFWMALALTDGFDGWLARKQGTTRSGAFLDPLADKFLALGAMGALVAERRFWWLPVVLIAGRELGISFYRAWEGRHGITIPARQWAKVKTVVQDVAVGLALLPSLAHDDAVANSVLWIAVVLTVVTGVQYLLDGARVREAQRSAQGMH